MYFTSSVILISTFELFSPSFSNFENCSRNLDMQELDYNPSKKDLTDAKIHHLLAEELKPYKRVSKSIVYAIQSSQLNKAHAHKYTIETYSNHTSIQCVNANNIEFIFAHQIYTIWFVSNLFCFFSSKYLCTISRRTRQKCWYELKPRWNSIN